MNNYLQIIGDKVKKNKKTENLVTLIVLFVILLIAVNYIFKEEEKTESTNAISDNVSFNVAQENTLENKIEGILNAIDGVSDAKVIISYSNTEKINPIYDTKQDVEEDNNGSSKITTEKNVAYEEVNGEKVAIVESKDIAKAEGAIVVFNSTENISHVLEVKEAVSAVTGISIHKIQVFEN